MTTYDCIVIGGGPAGLSAALTLRARNLSVAVVANDPKENPLWKSERVANYPGMENATGAQILTAMRAQAEACGAEFVPARALSAMDMGEGFLKAMPHEVALRFPGADDYGFARRLVERLGLFELDPAQDLLASHADDVFAARTTDGATTVVYVPTSVELKLHGDLTGAHLTCYDLLERATVPVEAAYEAEADVTTVRQPVCMEDALLVIA